MRESAPHDKIHIKNRGICARDRCGSSHILYDFQSLRSRDEALKLNKSQ